MKKTDLAYVAGIIDGEGTIGLVRRKNKNGTHIYYPRVGVCMTNEWICRWFQFSFGGGVCPHKTPEGCKPAWHWYVTKRSAYEFLKAIYPFLRIKKLQAEVAIQIREAKEYRKRLKPSDRAFQEAQSILMEKLNKRGS